MGFQTRKKNKICKIIIDIPEEDHVKLKTILKARGYSIKEGVHNLIKQFNQSKISLDKNL